MLATSPAYNIYVHSEANCDLADLNAAAKPLEHTVSEARYTYLQEACHGSDLTVFSSMVDIVELALEHMSALTAGDNFTIDQLRCDAKVLQLQMNYDRLVAQMSSMSLECGRCRLLFPEPGTETLHN